MKQLGTRIGMSPQSVVDLERREQKETISVAKLRQAANALDCELRIVFVPKPSLQETIRRQATRKAREEREERDQLIHTMRLEAQEAGVEDAFDEGRAVERWLAVHRRRLWD